MLPSVEQKLNELLKKLDEYVKLMCEIERLMEPVHQLELFEDNDCLHCSS